MIQIMLVNTNESHIDRNGGQKMRKRHANRGFSRSLAQLVSATVVVLVTLSSALAQNLVQNGSFEEPVIDSSQRTFSAGQELGGWYVAEGSIDLISAMYGYGPARRGSQFVHLGAGGARGAIVQDIIVSLPGIYRLSFAISGYTQHYGARVMQVSLANWSDTFVFDYVPPPWEPTNRAYWFGFLAADITIPRSGIYALTFKSVTEFHWSGPFVDDVSLVPISVVPEPASVLTLGVGITSLLALCRRKR